MQTNAQLAAKLLRDGAAFFRAVGEQNPQIADEMETNAHTFQVVADLVENNPTGVAPPVEGDDDEGPSVQ